MAYTQLTQSTASIEYTRALGGTGLHIGILGALPTGMLFMQFLAAYVANHIRFRKPLWFWLTLLQRVILIPVVAGPSLWPEVPAVVWVWCVLAAFALNQGLTHFTTPLWLSWMGDYLPHDGLNTYWGVRHFWMQLAAAASLIGTALFLGQPGMDIRYGFAVLVAVGGVLGVIDILLFLKVDEPPVTRLPTSSVREILAGPFGHPEFRSFIGFTCFWHVAAMIGAPFISLYLLQYVGMQLFQVLLLWTGAWAGGAISSRWLGRMAERHGNRPVLILCTALKSVNMVALLLVPREPWLSFWLLLPVFMVDMALNTGITIANNGYMIKNSPVANRTMYIAAGTAIAGLCGGVASIVSGQVLTGISDWPIAPGWWNFTGFHVLFGVSLMMRLAAVLLVRRVRERDALPTTKVVKLLIGINPIRFLRYRAGPYEWRWRSESVVLSEKWAETGARAGDRAQPAQAGGEDGLSQIEVATADNSMIDTESQEGTSEDIPPSLLIRVRSA